MDAKKNKDQLAQGLDRLDQVEVAELSDADLESVAGGVEAIDKDINCNSSWCCSNVEE